MEDKSNTISSSDPNPKEQPTRVWVEGPIIVGAGPSGLAVAASLRLRSLPFLILEKSDTIASLWHSHTYDRLSLHLPKHFCQLPHLPFPHNFPTYPSKSQFLTYLSSYTKAFSLRPLFRHAVTDARFDPALSAWRVTTSPSSAEFVSRWLVVATGENAEPAVPKLQGVEIFLEGKMKNKRVAHTSDYKTGEEYRGKKVLVVGCGNSGMEVCFDLCEHGAFPFMSIRSGVRLQI